MTLIASGRVVDLLFLLITVALMVFYAWKWQKGHVAELRRFSIMDGFRESIEKCAEEGKPALYNMLMSKLTDLSTSVTMASLNCLSVVAGHAAELGVPLYVPYLEAETGPIIDSILREAYTSKNTIESYKPENVIFIPFLSHTPGTIGLMMREKIGANIMLGHAYFGTVQFCMVGHQLNAYQVGGTEGLGNLPYLLLSCNHCLLGDEVYAAGAYAGKDPLMSNMLRAEDLFKILALAVIVFGVVLLNTGFYQVLDFLAM